MNKLQLIDLLKQKETGTFGQTFYSTEGVINLIMHLDDEKPQEQKADLEKFEQLIYSAIQQAVYDIDTNDLIDYSSADFSLSGNEINLDNIEFNTYDLTDHIQKYVKEAIEELKEEEEENN
jgi:hypothetical protein